MANIANPITLFAPSSELASATGSLDMGSDSDFSELFAELADDAETGKPQLGLEMEGIDELLPQGQKLAVNDDIVVDADSTDLLSQLDSYFAALSADGNQVPTEANGAAAKVSDNPMGSNASNDELLAPALSPKGAQSAASGMIESKPLLADTAQAISSNLTATATATATTTATTTAATAAAAAAATATATAAAAAAATATATVSPNTEPADNLLMANSIATGQPMNETGIAADKIAPKPAVANILVNSGTLINDKSLKGQVNGVSLEQAAVVATELQAGSSEDPSATTMKEPLSQGKLELSGNAVNVAKEPLNSNLMSALAAPTEAAMDNSHSTESEPNMLTGVRGESRGATLPNATTAANAQAEVMKQPVNAERMVPELRDRLQMMVNTDKLSAEIRLDPPELGALQVRIQMNGDQANVQIVTQQGQAKDMIEQALPRLREMLQEQGLQLGQTDVSQQQAGDDGGQQQPGHGAGFSSDNSDSDVEMVTVTGRTDSGGIDYFA
ncbi:flagellar hook-length control protein FliK [Ferrimonas lipolytica]|uniref:flagellar hook-length control protein FliK n=1 Tax=Ferrimonas lipolytica TaxID=2724191 RepID=UPI00193141BA|nr:flagellar hook-length control protein FliK [Ferrimonas lipolytica]